MGSLKAEQRQRAETSGVACEGEQLRREARDSIEESELVRASGSAAIVRRCLTAELARVQQLSRNRSLALKLAPERSDDGTAKAKSSEDWRRGRGAGAD